LGDPVILGGGAISSAMEPMAPFFDAILIGDAEDVIDDMVDMIIAWKKSGLPRDILHKKLATLPGIYVPALYEIAYNQDGTIERITGIAPAKPKIRKTTVSDLDNIPYPVKPVVPNIEVIHDRINIEIMRGCPNLCRFCQAVQHYRPLKHRSIKKILELCEETYANTGYEEISLTSLSTADFPGIEQLLGELSDQFGSRKVNVALPSLRIGQQLKALPKLAGSVRKAGLTMAPEVATDRLRTIINKSIRNSDFLAGCEAAYRAGYRLLKFYFLIGCPTETEDDLAAIVDLINEAGLLRKKISGKRAQINVSISCHIPKPHTPFQWAAMDTREELRAKQRYILARNQTKLHRFKFHDVHMSYLESVFSRGDRRLAAALLKAREQGIRMDAWNECFDMHRWQEVFADSSIDPDFYALHARAADEILPWDMIELDTPSSYLKKEGQRAQII
ncbi:MAG: TIGR03960 family B12-binding radical SAM protein, partial [Candidatus Latescibacterota bacterium]